MTATSQCTEIDFFPNATVAEYGMIDYDEDDKMGTCQKIMAEIYTRGPVAATINAEPIVKYTGGIFTEEGLPEESNHIVAITGWGTDPDTGIKYWLIRNSWGQYWGGALGRFFVLRDSGHHYNRSES